MPEQLELPYLPQCLQFTGPEVLWLGCVLIVPGVILALAAVDMARKHPDRPWTKRLAVIWWVGVPLYFFVEQWLMQNWLLTSGEAGKPLAEFIHEAGERGSRVWLAVGALLYFLLEKKAPGSPG